MEFWNETEPTAKREHQCDACRQPIAVGATYANMRGKFAGDFFVTKQHTECRNAEVELAQIKDLPGEMLVLMVTEMAEAYDAWLTGELDDKLADFPGFPVEMGDLGTRWADFCGAMMAGRIIQPDPANNPGDMMFREIIDIARKYEAIRKTPAAVGEPEHADFLPSMDVPTMIDVKLAFNANREDHRVENRLKADGKRT